MNLVKKRMAKKSKWGLYLQDSELAKETSFAPGTHFAYIIDKVKKKITITPATGGNTVASRASDKEERSIIHIRSKEALSLFSEAEQLQISIYDEEIVVEGFIQEQTKEGKIYQFPYALHTSFSELVQASGYGQQLHLFDYLSEEDRADIPSQLDPLLRVASLFSGAGMMDLGFLQEEFSIEFALEYNEKDTGANETYAHNIGDHILREDIRELNKSLIPNVDVLIGGSPCQGFSNSNRYTHFLDNPNNQLVLEYIESVKASSPSVFVLENVPQILTAGEGQFKREIYQELSDYHITSGVLNSADFGSAQIRQRAFFIGSKIGPISLPKPTFLSTAYRTVRDAFVGLSRFTPNQSDYSTAKELTQQRMAYVPPGGNIFDIPESIRPKGLHSNVYKRLEYDKPSITIPNVRKSMITHPEHNRILSVRECARLFDIPDDFVFQGTLSSKQQQVGNGVPVRMASAIARQIKNAFANLLSPNRMPVLV